MPADSFDHNRSRSRRMRGASSASPAVASRAASASPTIPGTSSVPLRMPRS